MQRLMAEISSGKRCGVEAIEALLLIAEWEPRCMLPDSARISCGQEDLAAWMHVGMAIRLAHALKLDNTVYKKESNEAALRERPAWMACYLSNRQISVRLGRPFSCRGLEPSIIYGRYGFPAVYSNRAGHDSFACIFRARLELTQIYTNVHETLYCHLEKDAQRIVSGTYTALLDNFRGVIAAWHSVWGSLTCSPNVKILLQLSYEYLRLYTNAFAFQTFILRESSTRDLPSDAIGIDRIGGTGALPEARFIFEAIDAAKSLLTTFNNYLLPKTTIMHFPVRFPLYCVNATVFLYSTWIASLLSAPEKASVRRLIADTIKRFREGSEGSEEASKPWAQICQLVGSSMEAHRRGQG
ncbi:hypothetical protein BJX70DRAFT_200548 [Aspergillus crustosus]